MFPLLILPKLLGALTSMTKSTGSLAEGAAKSASDANEVASDGMKNAVLKNVSDSTPAEESGGGETAEDTKEMFGGLDLANVKSALDDSGPMGPPVPVKGGVYKQIFEVNKNMLGSLLRIEQTMKMLLAIEFERIQGMQQTDSKSLIDAADTKKVKEKKKSGLLGAAASGVGGMLGGAFSKTKGAFSGNFGKFVGLGAIIFLFKKFETEIKDATAEILKYFKSVYDVFKEEGLGAAFKKIGDDLKNEFLPKIKNITLDFLDMMFTVIKEAIFGASGDKRIQQEVGDANISRTAITTLTSKAVEGGADLSKMKFNAAGIITGTNSGDTPLTYKENRLLKSKIDDHVKAMGQISEESDGRIQWSTFPGYKFGQYSLMNIDDIFRLHPISDFINANPVVDGTEYPDWGILSNINLNEMGGIDRTMSEDRVDEITAVLRAKTNAYQSKDFVELERLQGDYLDLNPTVFESNRFKTTNTTPGQSSLSAVGIMSSGANRFNINQDNKKVDKSVKVQQSEVNNVAMAAGNENSTARMLGDVVGFSNTTGYMMG